MEVFIEQTTPHVFNELYPQFQKIDSIESFNDYIAYKQSDGYSKEGLLKMALSFYLEINPLHSDNTKYGLALHTKQVVEEFEQKERNGQKISLEDCDHLIFGLISVVSKKTPDRIDNSYIHPRAIALNAQEAALCESFIGWLAARGAPVIRKDLSLSILDYALRWHDYTVAEIVLTAHAGSGYVSPDFRGYTMQEGVKKSRSTAREIIEGLAQDAPDFEPIQRLNQAVATMALVVDVHDDPYLLPCFGIGWVIGPMKLKIVGACGVVVLQHVWLKYPIIMIKKVRLAID